MTSVAKPLTGRKVFAIAIGAFGVIITANLALVYSAVGSFPGLEVKNTYVASQFFDTDRARQAALGWEINARYQDETILLDMKDSGGQILRPRDLSASIGRATHANADVTLPFLATDTGFQAPITLAPGKWELRLSAMAEDGTAFRQRISIWAR